jgi:hypothetical protein
MGTMDFIGEPKRLRDLRLGLAKAIPKSPNDRATLDELRGKPLGPLLVDFVNWRSRYVGARPRKVTLEPAATADPRWTTQVTRIRHLLEKVERGEDLSAHLSLDPHSRGYAPAAHAPGATDKWLDKDFLLATNGYHHFHLGTTVERRGHAERTDELIFAHVTRDGFHVIAVSDHSVFDPSSVERHQLHCAHRAYAFRNLPPGSYVIGTALATSGHTCQAVYYAQHCARTILTIERKLDERDFVELVLADLPIDAPPQPRWDWLFQHLDLCLFERQTRTLVTIEKGRN